MQYVMDVAISESEIKDIKEAVKENIHVNIDNYVTSFLQRRIQNRMTVTGIKSYSEYISYLKKDSVESLALNANLSINVTQFFRNPEMWDAFKEKVIPEVIKLSNDIRPIHAWSAGCAVGNESYSLAMMFSDAVQTKNKKFRVTATDINPTSIGVAETGQYELEILKNVPKPSFLKFLEKVDDNLYKFRDDLKKTIHFKVGDIASFSISQVDIIMCRNLLIYYDDAAKDLLFKKFYRTLKDDGFLVLGMAEVIPRSMKESFDVVDANVRIYRKNPSKPI